jgi:hypothetical protein
VFGPKEERKTLKELLGFFRYLFEKSESKNRQVS